MDNIYAILLLIVGMTMFLCTIAYYVGFHSGYAKCLKEYEKRETAKPSN